MLYVQKTPKKQLRMKPCVQKTTFGIVCKKNYM